MRTASKESKGGLLFGRKSLQLIAWRVLSLVLVTVLLIPCTWAQTEPALKLLVSDKTPLPLPNTFGVPSWLDINQAGDFVFLGPSGTGLFLRRAGSSVAQLLLQMGDAMPGLPNSRVDAISSAAIDGAGVVVARVIFSLPSGESRNAILLYEGAGFRTVVSSNEEAPGSGGSTYGSVSLIGLNDAGDIAFSASLAREGSLDPSRTARYLVPVGGSPTFLVADGHSAPGTGGTLGPIPYSSDYSRALNERREFFFYAPIVGGTDGYGIFVASASGLRKIVAQGDATPVGGTFTITSGTYWLSNNAGQVVFYANNGIWMYTPDAGIAKIVAVNDAGPTDLGEGVFTSILGSSFYLAFNDSGEVVFRGSVRIGTQTRAGLFRYRPSQPLETVAYSGQAVPGGFVLGGIFQGVSMNNGGLATFTASLQSGGYGVFQQETGSPPQQVVLQGQPAPLPGGGALSASPSTTRTLEDGAAYFSVDVYGGVADYVVLLASSSGGRVLMSTEDALPASARVSLRTNSVGNAGDYVGFFARRAGGKTSIFVHNVSTGVTSRVMSDGDEAPGAGGGRLRLQTSTKVHVNSSGMVALFALVVGGTTSRGIFAWTPEAGLGKVVAAGDTHPESGGTFLSLQMESLAPSPLNASGQVLFWGSLSGINRYVDPCSTATSRSGWFLGSLGNPPQKVVLTGDAGHVYSLGTYTSIQSGFGAVDDAGGWVGFYAQIKIGTSQINGIFAGGPSPMNSCWPFSQPVVWTGEWLTELPPVFASPGVAFLTGGPSGGAFGGGWGAAALNGEPAPTGGYYDFARAQSGDLYDVALNHAGDFAFRALLTGGGVDAGYFFCRSSRLWGFPCVTETVALPGWPAPGTSGAFGAMRRGVNAIPGELFTASPSGEVAFSAHVDEGGVLRAGMWRYRWDGTHEKIFVRGDPAPESGGGVLVGTQTLGIAYSNNERLAFFAGVLGGEISDAIYTTYPIPSQADLALEGFSSPYPALAGREVTYGISLSNPGPGVAEDAMVTIPLLPPEVSPIPISCAASHGSVTPSWPLWPHSWLDLDGKKCEADYQLLHPRASGTVNVVAPLTCAIRDGTGVTLYASASWPAWGPNPVSKSAEIQIRVTNAPPVITLSTPAIEVIVPDAEATGATVDLTGVASATDDCDPNPVLTNNAPPIFPIGTTVVTYTATDVGGNSSHAELIVNVVYIFGGFGAPIRTESTASFRTSGGARQMGSAQLTTLSSSASVFRLGRVIPLKFQLTAADGTLVTNAVARLQIYKVSNAVLGTVQEYTPEAPGNSNAGNLFRYDPTAGQYVYNLSTAGFSEGTYLLVVQLDDGTEHAVLVSVR